MSALVEPNPINREPGRPASAQVSWPLRIEVNDLPPSPNRRMHWACRRRILKPLVDSIAWQARAARQGLPGKQPLQHAHVVAKMVHRKPPLRDWDNCVSSLKECIDALIVGQLLVDDGPEHLTLAVVQVLGPRRGLTLEIWPLEVQA
jgi:hypothetical protein